MEVTQAAPARVYGSQKSLLLSSFLFTTKLICPGKLLPFLRKHAEMMGSREVKVLSMEMEKPQPFNFTTQGSMKG